MEPFSLTKVPTINGSISTPHPTNFLRLFSSFQTQSMKVDFVPLHNAGNETLYDLKLHPKLYKTNVAKIYKFIR